MEIVKSHIGRIIVIAIIIYTRTKTVVFRSV